VGYEEALAVLRSWSGEAVVVRLDPEGTVLAGRLSELDSAGIDGALFGLDSERLTGVAFAHFRDGVRAAGGDAHELVVEQGRVTVTVTRAG
jgi:hypothetical protein